MKVFLMVYVNYVALIAQHVKNLKIIIDALLVTN